MSPSLNTLPLVATCHPAVSITARRARSIWLLCVTLLWLAAALQLTGCSSTDNARDSNKTVEVLTAEAKEEADSGGWDAAIKLYDTIQARFPFGRAAQQAQINQIYAQWKVGDNAQALANADRFIKQYPVHPALDYVFYLRGLINFNDNAGVFGYIARQDPSERDPKALRDSFDAFRELVARFPDSKYAEDARLRMTWLVNAMASYEVHVARYYFRRGAYLAAANRAQSAVHDFQKAPATEEALAIMIASYDALKMQQLRDDTQRVLKQSFPNSKFNNAQLGRVDQAWWKLW